MKITTARRISQVFFLLLLCWLAVVTTVGAKWWQHRGWPVNWLLQLDPLAAVGTLLSSHTLYAGLAWAGATVAGTILLGRFFCGWVCPFGTIHQFFGWLGRKGKSLPRQVEANRYRRSQSIKYYILAGLLAAAAMTPSSLLMGLLDPLPLITRSVNLAVLPLADAGAQKLSTTPRFYEWSWLIGGMLLAAVAANFIVPRFYCRFVCPLGAMLGVLGRWSVFRIGKRGSHCTNCKLCEKDCEGACSPASQIRISECVLCGNCLHACPHGLLAYQARKSCAGEVAGPDVTRRGLLLSIASGLAIPPLLRLSGSTEGNWNALVIRPPGSLDEKRFLDRCIRCGQCMRVCPTNVIQPGGLANGIEGLWTPVLNNRVGTSGCQLNCAACGSVCPTAAIRPFSLDEKLGRGEFASAGPLRMGAAFVDRGRCLPWAMNIPCIVCQENCPVSPKAITVREEFSPVAGGEFKVASASGATIQLAGAALSPGKFASGDYFCRVADGKRVAIVANTAETVTVSAGKDWAVPAEGQTVTIQIRLQQPFVDVQACTGCGVCEHECPVSGLRAIRVTAENESRNREHSLLL
ncbi:MAG: 4Fe-4S binding protein [Phycisphaerae bacterium]|jgi:polyferredoxin